MGSASGVGGGRDGGGTLNEIMELTEGQMEELMYQVGRLRLIVNFGECITFPNGLVIDKRPLAMPPSTTYMGTGLRVAW